MPLQRQPVPVDTRHINEVEEGAWDSDDTPARLFEQLRNDKRSQTKFDAVLEEIHQHQANLGLDHTP